MYAEDSMRSALASETIIFNQIYISDGFSSQFQYAVSQKVNNLTKNDQSPEKFIFLKKFVFNFLC